MNKEKLVDDLDDIIYVSDPITYDLYYVNKMGKECVGIQGDNYEGLKCYKVLQGLDQPCEFCTNKLLKREEFYVWEHTNTHLNRHFIVKDKLIDWNDKPARMEYAIDITYKENISKQLAMKLDIEHAVVDCISSLFSSADLEEAINLVLQTIGTFYDADRAYIFENEYTTQTCSNTYEWCNQGTQPQMDNLTNLPLSLLPHWMESFENDKALIVHDLNEKKEEWKEEYSLLHTQNIVSLYVVPMIIDKELSGFIGIDNPKKHEDDISLLDSLTYFIMSEIKKRRLQTRLEYMGYHDALTGLLTRNSYMEYIHQQEDNIKSLGVVVADINGLKLINQNYGHEFGNHQVMNVANTLCQYFEKNRLYRLSGDEFVGLCEDVQREAFLADVQKLKKELEEKSVYGVTIGYTWSDSDIDVKELMNHADELLYIEKQKYYKNSYITNKHHSPMLLNRLLEEIRKGRYKMFLQPKICTETSEIIGAEALARYYDDQGSIVPPGKFIPLMEHEKTVKYIDFFIYEEVCKTLAEWKKKGYTLGKISLNFSRITMMEEDLIEVLIKIHSKYDIPRNCIEIEITETIGEMERETIAEIGSNIKKLGFGISLDDFGAKYTSMSILTVMNFDELKLDRSLINNLVKNKNNRTIVKYVIEMCKEMNVRSIAEGVETDEQLELLKELSCDLVQGYLFSKPISLEDFEKKYKKRLKSKAC